MHRFPYDSEYRFVRVCTIMTHFVQGKNPYFSHVRLTCLSLLYSPGTNERTNEKKKLITSPIQTPRSPQTMECWNQPLFIQKERHTQVQKSKRFVYKCEATYT